MSVPQRRSVDRAEGTPVPILAHPNRWLLLVIVGFGFTTWAAFLYIGIRARRRGWPAWAAAYALMRFSGEPSALWLHRIHRRSDRCADRLDRRDGAHRGRQERRRAAGLATVRRRQAEISLRQARFSRLAFA